MEKKIKNINIICFITFVLMNVFVLIEFLIRKNIVNYYNAATFLISYKNGFVSRGFIGTILNLVPTEKYLIAIAMITGIGVIIFTIFIFKNVFYVFFERMNEDVCFWFLFMMSSNTVLHFTFRNSHTKMDLFWYLLFIPIFMNFLNFEKHKIRNIIFLFSFSVVSILIHQGFIFILVPFILVLLWDIDEKKILIPYCFIIGITFLLCQFLGKGNYDLIAEEVYEKTNSIFYEKEIAWGYIRRMLYMEYHLSIFEHFKLLKEEFLRVNFKMFLYLNIFNIINIFVLVKMFIYTYKEKIKLYLPFLCISQLPLYILTIDYERWSILFLLNLQLLIIYRLRKGESVEIETPSNIMKFLFIINIGLIFYTQFKLGVKMI